MLLCRRSASLFRWPVAFTHSYGDLLPAVQLAQKHAVCVRQAQSARVQRRNNVVHKPRVPRAPVQRDPEMIRRSNRIQAVPARSYSEYVLARLSVPLCLVQ